MQTIKILSRVVFSLLFVTASIQPIGQIELFAHQMESNLVPYLQATIAQAQKAQIPVHTGLGAIAQHMLQELQLKKVTELLNQEHIQTVGSQFFIDFCLCYKATLEQINQQTLSEQDKNELIYKEFSFLFDHYFPGFIWPYPEFSIGQLLIDNAQLSFAENKDIGYIALYTLKCWAKHEAELSDALQAQELPGK